jgi:sugar O-acyltransferase (sialic acid O-acetyltransferase NeuD family)
MNNLKNNRDKVVCVGGGGNAKVLIDIILNDNNYSLVGITEVAGNLFQEKINGIPVIGSDEVLPRLFDEGVKFAFVGMGTVGNTSERTKIYQKIEAIGFAPLTIIHPSAMIALTAELGKGGCFMAGAIINPYAKIGHNVIVNTGALVEHDCLINDHVCISPGAILGGEVTVGEQSFIGMGALIKQGVTIGRNIIIGMGAVVLDDIPDGETVAGNPAHKLEKQALEISGNS